MSKTVRRGYFPNDEKEFGDEEIKKLRSAGNDLYYLLNQGYNIKGASIFIGNHYLLSQRQRLALIRSISSKKDIEIRKAKEIINGFGEKVINIDGFNTIITLEVALSNSILLKCMDGTFRDLAGLRGSYRLIDKTAVAIKMIGEILRENKIKKIVFYLDAPVSNSGKLKQKILEILGIYDFTVQVENINNVDSVLQELDNVITSDAIILDKCKSWINLNRRVIEKYITNCPYIAIKEFNI